MGISQEKPWAGRATEAGSGRALLKILYRGRVLVALLACVACWPAVAAAQEDRPQITTLPRRVQRKKDAGPRALGVLQLAANGKASLVPICILINGKFWDATAYKADPVPMSLEPGTVYEALRTGNSLGLFTVGSALRSNAANAQSPWIGTGAWLPAGTEKPETSLKAEAEPVGIDTSDEPPRLTKNPAKQAPAGSTTPPAATPTAGDSKPAESKPPELKPAESKPPDSKPSESKPSDRPKSPESDSGAVAGDRPRLRRGKPAEPLFDDEIPGYTKPGAKPAANPGKIVASATATGPVQLIPAISDAAGPEPHSFTFEWLKDEEGERRAQIMALAKQELLAYLDAQAKAKIAPPTIPPARRKPSAKPPEPVFGTVQMIAYDLWTNNQPVVVFSAEAHVPPGPAGAPGSAADLQYSIVLVTYPDIYNNLHKLYVGVTDPRHLDVKPRLDLIDAVDADGDGRAELLFKETSDLGSGWVIYRATADKLWKVYDSWNPE